jgi:hypothetical protein
MSGLLLTATGAAEMDSGDGQYGENIAVYMKKVKKRAIERYCRTKTDI